VRIIFVRHGRTRSNVDHLLDTAYPGAPLDDVGLAQAEGLVARLGGEPIEVVMTSDLTRAWQTGQPLARALGVPLIAHPGVREIAAGAWEMATQWEGYLGVLVSWLTDLTVTIPGGQDGASFFARFDQALAELADHDCAAVVSHGGALSTWLVGRTGLPVEGRWTLGNTGAAVVEGAPGAWRTVAWDGRDLPT
jgi:probable phosphoglycerate mutase